MLRIAVIVICSLVAGAWANLLESYNIDPDKVSVSGLSAGGFMAVQMHVAYSKLFMGVGVIAGGPYYCAKGSLTTATTTCMYASSALLNVDTLVTKTFEYEKANAIDPVSNMAKDKIYIFSGTEDTTVPPKVVGAVEEYYTHFTSDLNIRSNMDIEAVHGFPTKNYGEECGKVNYLTYINNCDEDIAYYMLQHLYKDLQRPVYDEAPLSSGAVLAFDQTEFTGLFSNNGLDDEGYIFVPNQCLDRSVTCRLHLSLHGCKQGKETIGEKYITDTGYLEVAVANNIIILAPQIKKDFINNPNGCFDWWGYTDKDYGTVFNFQMLTSYLADNFSICGLLSKCGCNTLSKKSVILSKYFQSWYKKFTKDGLEFGVLNCEASSGKAQICKNENSVNTCKTQQHLWYCAMPNDVTVELCGQAYKKYKR